MILLFGRDPEKIHFPISLVRLQKTSPDIRSSGEEVRVSLIVNVMMIYEYMIICWKIFDNQEFHRQCSMSLIEMWWLRDDVVKRSYDCLIADIQGKSIFHETPRNIWNFFTPTIFTIWCPAMQFRFRCLKIYLFQTERILVCVPHNVWVFCLWFHLHRPGSLFGLFPGNQVAPWLLVLWPGGDLGWEFDWLRFHRNTGVIS